MSTQEKSKDPTEEVTKSVEETLKAAEEIQNSERGSEEKDSNIVAGIDDMRSAFYDTALNLFQAAKSLKPYDILYTDNLLQQAQYFLNLADNYDTLYSIAKMSSEMPLNNLSNKIPEEAVEKIDDYASAIQNRMDTLKNKANVTKEVEEDVDNIVKSIKEKIEKK